MSQPPSKPYRVAHAALSDVGMRRQNNQDAVVAIVDGEGADPQRGHFFMVADGMGAHAAGELASKMAVDAVPHAYRKRTGTPPPAALRRAVQEANEQIFAKGQSSPELRGMGTTCTCLVLLPGTAMVAHVGDSRVYRARGATLEQLTFDHSLVWEMAAASHVSAEKVPACIPKNVITRSLGPHESVNVDLEGPTAVLPGDTFLLCSDGLSGVVGDEEIGALIATMPPDESAPTLVDLANLRGGPDNISVIVARVDAEEDGTGKPPRAGRFRRVPVSTWLGVVGSLAAVLVFAAYQHPAGALIAAAGFGASIMVALMQHAAPPAIAPEAAAGGPYGNGPYRRWDCRLGARATDKINAVVDELAQVEPQFSENGAGAPIDWGPFHDHRRAAEQAAQQGDHAEALRAGGRAIRVLMRQVRANRDA